MGMNKIKGLTRDIKYVKYQCSLMHSIMKHFPCAKVPLKLLETWTHCHWLNSKGKLHRPGRWAQAHSCTLMTIHTSDSVTANQTNSTKPWLGDARWVSMLARLRCTSSTCNPLRAGHVACTSEGLNRIKLC